MTHHCHSHLGHVIGCSSAKSFNANWWRHINYTSKVILLHMWKTRLCYQKRATRVDTCHKSIIPIESINNVDEHDTTEID